MEQRFSAICCLNGLNSNSKYKRALWVVNLSNICSCSACPQLHIVVVLCVLIALSSPIRNMPNLAILERKGRHREDCDCMVRGNDKSQDLNKKVSASEMGPLSQPQEIYRRTAPFLNQLRHAVQGIVRFATPQILAIHLK